ncbi:MAG: glycoside hydrolase family 3 C-terminal domain-containing protein [Clostridia bacterium]|nr:glycoside hydrolase family 3 C-terminal domain-containing protein [Clostridia bacterium]MDE7328843.1 glycoside hydrolase family 3 C-terminal domain-containing protein [Clostridia bacterium]
MKYADLIAQMSLEEKAGLCSGKDMWHTKDVKRLGIPSVMVCDGPHGLRKQDTSGVSTNLDQSVDAICFPTASATACSWDKDLLYEMGCTLGEEAVAENIAVLLGPGTNIKRNPLCGRNFEYFSEDPYLAGMLSAYFINGVQSKNVGTSIKHYCANNQETYRMTINSVVDERTLREIYLLPFEIAVKLSQPRTIMASYNLINDTYATENDFVLNKVLRDEWGFKGLVVSDWGATNQRVKGIAAGHDLEMPSSGGMNDKLIVKAVKDGSLDEAIVDQAVDRVLDMVMPTMQNPTDATYDKEEHYQIAKRIASESAVLLKNEEEALPLKAQKILLVGELAIQPRFQGAGSSFINCTKITNIADSLQNAGVEYEFTSGYNLDDDNEKKNAKLRKNAVELAKKYDSVLVVAGLPGSYEAEGFDRTHIELPQSHNQLIDELAKVNKNVNVVLTMGSSVTMPWADSVKSILCMYLGGQASGEACVDLLLGKANPCGKLAETFALDLKDVPSSQNFPGARFSVEYREGLYVGYRYFNTANVPVLFPFGYGLSYTKFEYSNLQLSAKTISDKDILTVSVDVQNVGEVDGKEIVQLYVNDVEFTAYTPYQQLKGFEKVSLKAGEKKTVTFSLDKRSFAFYNVDAGDWQVESGEFKIMIGASSRDIKAVESVIVNSSDATPITATDKDSWYMNPSDRQIGKEEFLAMSKLNVKEDYRIAKKGEFTADDSFEDMSHTSGLARFALKIAKPAIRMSMKAKKNDPNYLMIYEVMKTSPMRALAFSSQGMFNMKMVDGVVTIMNGKFFKGVGMVLKNIGGDEEDKAKKKELKAQEKAEKKAAKK